MKACDLSRDEIAAFLETDDGMAFLEATDAKWSEAIEPMRQAGFIASAYGGTAVMMTYANAMEVGVEQAVRMLQMGGVEVPIGRSNQ